MFQQVILNYITLMLNSNEPIKVARVQKLAFTDIDFFYFPCFIFKENQVIVE